MANAATTYSEDLRTAEDDAAIDGLSAAVHVLLPALEQFTRFDQLERTACFINPRTTLADIEAIVEEVVACGAEAWATMNHT